MDDIERPRSRVLLVRHGEAAYETDGNADSGGSLTVTGRNQSLRLGQRLQQLHASTIVCSELSRAVQTAEIAAAVLSLPVTVRMGLQEYDVGDERGRPYNAGLFEPLLLNWLAGELAEHVSGGENGYAVARRMFAVLDDIAEAFPGKTVAVVSHGAAIISVLGSIAPASTDLPADANDMPGCDMYLLERTSGRWLLTGRDRG